jgi:hypothetical protein
MRGGMMRKILLLIAFLVSTSVSVGQTLSAGDIAIIGVSVDDEKVLIVALVDIPSNETVFFTDDEWNGSSFNTGEGFISWVTPSITAGDVVELTTTSSTAGGTVSTANGSFTLSNSGDGVFFYQTSNNLYDGTATCLAFAGEDAGDAGTLTGTGLTEGTSAVYFGGDNGIYTGTRTGQDKATYQSLIYNSANWTTSGSSQTFDLTDFTFSGSTPDPEPTNHVTSFSAAANGHSQIDLTWSDNDGAQAAAGFLILANTTGTFSDPVDGTAQSDDTDMSDNSGRINVNSGAESYSFTGLNAETQYYFKIFPYTNSGSNIDYKTDGTVPTDDATTGAAPVLPNAWINEFHYDDDSGDLNEFIEVVIQNPGSYTLSDFSVTLYNGNGGSSYDSETVDNFTEGSLDPDDNSYRYYYWGPFLNIIQNGSPDGFSLSHDGNLIQFLSYEGTFTASGGDADGETSSDIGVSESNSTSVGSSLGLTGTGTKYSDFTWTSFADDTPGAKNGSQALPVSLTSFTASPFEGGVELNWETATEVNNYGFEIERKNDGMDEWMNVGFVQGHGNSNSPKQYSFVDANAPAGDLQYRLKQIDTDGTFTYYGTIAEVNNGITSVDNNSIPTEFALDQNYPNPFNPSTTITYSIPVVDALSGVEGQHVKLVVYDLLGRQIATLVDTQQAPGIYSVNFDASQLTSGIYFYSISSDKFNSVKKMSLIK